VTAIGNDVDYMSAPRDYADLFKTYYSYVINLCGQFGIDENNKEDAACEILLRFMERGSLEKFDPSLRFDYKGEQRPARFKSYLSRAVDMYSRGIRDKQHKLARREQQLCDTVPIGPALQREQSYQSTANLASWAEVFGVGQDDHADAVENMIDFDAESAALRAMLAEIPRRNSHDRCDLAELFDAVRAQVTAFGEYDIAILKDKFGVSTTAMHSWMWWLKANVAHFYGRPLPAKRPRRTRS
jgi:hypothetical protein